jgi:PAS domain S-box-containing protein
VGPRFDPQRPKDHDEEFASVAAVAEHVDYEARYQLLVDSVVDYAIFFLTPSGHVATWNRGARRMKGYRADEIIGSHFSRFYEPHDVRAGVPDAALAAAAQAGHFEGEGWRVRKDGSRFYANTVITALVDADGELIGFAKVTKDITAWRAANEALRRYTNEIALAHDQLARAERVRDDVLSVAHHELRTPLAVILGSANVLGEHWDRLPDDERREMVAAMEQSGLRLRNLIEDMLTLATMRSGALDLRVRPIRVRDHLERARMHIRDAAVDVVCEPDLEVIAAPEALDHVLRNLVGNAVRHGRPPYQLRAAADGESARIVVEDHGDGVPPEFVDRLFDAFTQASNGPTRTAEGSGLGLAVVRVLVDSLGGDVRYEQIDGGGARFVVCLPRAKQHAAPTTVVTELRRGRPRQGRVAR